MQQNWHNDPDKLMFIILARPQQQVQHNRELLDGQMIGDVNLYLTKAEDGQEQEQDAPYTRAEVEVMIPNPSFRRQGTASLALRLLYLYTLKHLSATTTYDLSATSFFCKIGEANRRSVRLFEKLGFEEVAKSEVWKEVEMQSRSAEKCLALWQGDLELHEIHI